MKTYHTTIPKKEYPYILEIRETFDARAICDCYDTDGVSRTSYSFDQLQPYSAEEYWDDIASFYNLDKPDFSTITSQEFLHYLNQQIREYKTIAEDYEEQAEKEGIDLYDLDSNELWEHDQAEEIAGMFVMLKEVVLNSDDCLVDLETQILPNLK